jgi:hypothetical protein
LCDQLLKAMQNAIREVRRWPKKEVQWFHVENRFAPMGVKMIGVFCDAVKEEALIQEMEKILEG